jgi:predicted Zn-dependent protease
MKPSISLAGFAAFPLWFSLILGTGAGNVASQTFALPDFGSSADLVMSSGEEKQLGRAFMRSVRAALPVIDDPLLNDYIESLGNRLVAASGTGAGRYNFFLIDQPLINAFAGPDGNVGVYSGLVLAAESESELAAVMAHEIAHVTQRHLMRAFEEQQRLSIPATALIVAAAILGAQVDADLGAAAIAGVQAATVQRQINFTRENEQEADRVGISTLAAAGFDPYAMPGFFERLSKASRLYENNAPEFLRTHPVTSNRIADALGRADRYGAKQRADDLRFHLTRASLRQRAYKDPAKAVAHFRSTLQAKRYRNETAERYGYALALARAGQPAAAREQLAGLLAAHPNQAEFIVLDAGLDTETGKATEAVVKLRTSSGLRPDNLPLRIAYAEALMAAGQPDRALGVLEGLALVRPGQTPVYELMADAALKSGKRAATHRYRAEAHYSAGDLEPAILQLELALKQRGSSFQESSRAQVRLDELRQEQAELKEKGSRFE